MTLSDLERSKLRCWIWSKIDTCMRRYFVRVNPRIQLFLVCSSELWGSLQKIPIFHTNCNYQAEGQGRWPSCFQISANVYEKYRNEVQEHIFDDVPSTSHCFLNTVPKNGKTFQNATPHRERFWGNWLPWVNSVLSPFQRNFIKTVIMEDYRLIFSCQLAELQTISRGSHQEGELNAFRMRNLRRQIRSMNNRFHSEDKLPWSHDYPLANHIATNKRSANCEMPLFSRLHLPFFRVSSENFPAKGFKIPPIGHHLAGPGHNLSILSQTAIPGMFAILTQIALAGSDTCAGWKTVASQRTLSYMEIATGTRPSGRPTLRYTACTSLKDTCKRGLKAPGINAVYLEPVTSYGTRSKLKVEMWSCCFSVASYWENDFKRLSIPRFFQPEYLQVLPTITQIYQPVLALLDYLSRAHEI